MELGICLFIESILPFVVLIFSQFRIDKKFYQPSKIAGWVVVIYESQRNFPKPAYEGLVKGFLKSCAAVGQYFNIYCLDSL